MSIIKMNDFFKISIAEAFDEYELHCKARNLSKNTLKRQVGLHSKTRLCKG